MSKYRFYPYGEVYFTEPRVTDTLSFAHVVDLHLPPVDEAAWPARYRHAIEWWNVDSGRPHATLPALLDQVAAAKVDFVFFGGDVLDYYDPATADYVVELCRQRGLKCHFQIGNHDYESDYLRFVTHECDAQVRAANGAKLAEHWQMPGLYHSFEQRGVRFVSLDTPYHKLDCGYGGRFDRAQADWLTEQLSFDGPIVVFLHVPFALPTNELRLRGVWNGNLAGVIEDEQGRRVKNAIAACPNVLGLFCGHTHVRFEDRLGHTCQFITGSGTQGDWRKVTIGPGPPPKSMRVAGEPTVD